MHEYSVVQALIERVEAEARARGSDAVHRISVTVGAASGLDVELFETAYATFRDRTVCANAELSVNIVPVQWQCTRCALAIVEGRPLRCDRCGSTVRLAAGDEIILDRIEMEVH